jgi:hypothetical protein
VVEADNCDLPCFSQSAILAPLRVFRQAGRDASVTLYGSSQKERPPLKKENPMEPAKSNNSIADDVLHLGSTSRLSPEEIAKALAHHKRHHGGNQNTAVKTGAGKKGKSGK